MRLMRKVLWKRLHGADCGEGGPYHSWYWAFQRAFQPSGTLGGGGPAGGAKSAIVDCMTLDGDSQGLKVYGEVQKQKVSG